MKKLDAKSFIRDIEDYYSHFMEEITERTNVKKHENRLNQYFIDKLHEKKSYEISRTRLNNSIKILNCAPSSKDIYKNS